MAEQGDATDRLRRSVVKLFTVIKQPNYYQPWDLGYQKNSGGLACVVEGQRIMTNAHVVRHQVYVQAQRAGGTKKFSAKVEHVDHDREVAILKVDDPQFFEGAVPVHFGELPPRQAKVSVCGFPMGGNELCITQGVVSRIEVRSYTHSRRHLLCIQTDAAINPGNSGGPVLANDATGELIGIAFQAHDSKDLAKTGYVVPVPVIRNVFQDIEDGSIGGVPDLGVYWQKIESDGLREYLELGPEQTGILITRITYGSSAWDILEEGDVLTAIDGVPIACDGSVPLRDHERVHFSHLVSRRQIGDPITVSLIRSGRPLELVVGLSKLVALIPRPEHDRRPTYYIFGGLVFMPITYNYLSTWAWKDVSPRWRSYYTEGTRSPRRKQIVIVNQVLAHDINVGFHQMRGVVVDRINGTDITEMADVLAALRRPAGKFHVIEVDHHSRHGDGSDYHSAFGSRIVIEAASAERATLEILAQYGIPADRSADL